MPTDARALPNVGEVLAPLLERVLRAEHPLLIAIAERLAAERYRSWAEIADHPQRRTALLACAEREEEIARRVEGLYADADTARSRLLASHPELAELNRTLFAGRPLAEQFAIQAQGERLGAATWRSFARTDADDERAAVLYGCAELEEASAVVLEEILAG